MIHHFDMGSCQPIGDESTARPTIIAPFDAATPVPRMKTVAEAVAEEKPRLPGIVAVLAVEHDLDAID